MVVFLEFFDQLPVEYHFVQEAGDVTAVNNGFRVAPTNARQALVCKAAAKRTIAVMAASEGEKYVKRCRPARLSAEGC